VHIHLIIDRVNTLLETYRLGLLIVEKRGYLHTAFRLYCITFWVINIRRIKLVICIDSPKYKKLILLDLCNIIATF